uniref:Uncharacterized protein n=1 Tax=Rhizophora mucronata TaxID=61149 RepID=A0A2P2N5I5_RHIMU
MFPFLNTSIIGNQNAISYVDTALRVKLCVFNDAGLIVLVSLIGVSRFLM